MIQIDGFIVGQLMSYVIDTFLYVSVFTSYFNKEQAKFFFCNGISNPKNDWLCRIAVTKNMLILTDGILKWQFLG